MRSRKVFSYLCTALYTEDVSYIPGTIPQCCINKTNFKEICTQCVSTLLDHHKPICQNIISGKCYSRRNEEYKQGQKKRKALTWQSAWPMRIFSAEVDQCVADWLVGNICQGDSRMIDYCLRVLKMELAIRLLMDFAMCCYDEAEKTMANWRPE